jgi:hypothetical protein
VLRGHRGAVQVSHLDGGADPRERAPEVLRAHARDRALHRRWQPFDQLLRGLRIDAERLLQPRLRCVVAIIEAEDHDIEGIGVSAHQAVPA